MICVSCSGAGYRTCRLCDGTAKVYAAPCAEAELTEEELRAYDDLDVYDPCPRCARGKITCSTCAGAGVVEPHAPGCRRDYCTCHIGAADTETIPLFPEAA